MAARKKILKNKKSTQHKAKRRSSFSVKRLLAPFLVLAGIAIVLSFTIAPRTSVLSSKTASEVATPTLSISPTPTTVE